MRRFKKQKEPSYWDVMDSVEKFMAVFIVVTFGFFIYLMVMWLDKNIQQSILSYYNEWGYSNRVIDLANLIYDKWKIL